VGPGLSPGQAAQFVSPLDIGAQRGDLACHNAGVTYGSIIPGMNVERCSVSHFMYMYTCWNAGCIGGMYKFYIISTSVN
jgi:hypothetical protein